VFEQLLVGLFLEAQARPPQQIIVDPDATDDPLHGARKAGSSTAIPSGRLGGASE
jgi:hypothetical protein